MERTIEKIKMMDEAALDKFSQDVFMAKEDLGDKSFKLLIKAIDIRRERLNKRDSLVVNGDMDDFSRNDMW